MAPIKMVVDVITGKAVAVKLTQIDDAWREAATL